MFLALIPNNTIKTIADYLDSRSTFIFLQTLENALLHYQKTLINKILLDGETTLVLMQNGTVYWKGRHRIDINFTQVNLQDRRCVDIAIKDGVILFLMEGGWVLGCGDNRYNQLGNLDTYIEEPTEIPGLQIYNIKRLMTRHHRTVFITHTGDVLCCGVNENNNLGIPKKCIKTPVKISSFENYEIDDVILGPKHTFFIDKKSKKIYACGYNKYSQTGLPKEQSDNPFSINIAFPTEINDLEGYEIISIATGKFHTIFVTRDKYGQNVTFACGYNRAGQLGLGQNFVNKQIKKLTKVSISDDIKTVCAGDVYSIFVTASGKMLFCGLLKTSPYETIPQHFLSSSLPKQLNSLSLYNIMVITNTYTKYKASYDNETTYSHKIVITTIEGLAVRFQFTECRSTLKNVQGFVNPYLIPIPGRMEITDKLTFINTLRKDKINKRNLQQSKYSNTFFIPPHTSTTNPNYKNQEENKYAHKKLPLDI